MTETDPFALQRSALNDVLFAEIGTEPNGMPLSLLSALARLGKDPWQEAQRLADLPGSLAVSDLTTIIVTTGAQSSSEAAPVAQRIAKLLPGGDGTINPSATSSPPKTRHVLRYAAALVTVALTTAVLVSVGAEPRSNPSAPRTEPSPKPTPIPAAAPASTAQVPTGD